MYLNIFFWLQSEDYRLEFSIFDQCVLAVFTFEILLKWYYGFWIFWKVGWNVLDFGIILALLLGPRKLLNTITWSCTVAVGTVVKLHQMYF